MLFRYALAISAVAMVITRLMRFADFYSATGVMPGGHNAVLLLLILSPLIPAAGLALNFWPKIMAVALAVLGMIHNLRYPAASGGFETYWPWLCWLAPTLPLGSAYATFLSLTYFLAGLAKLRSPDWADGEAVRNLLASPIWSKEWVRGWTDHPRLLQIAECSIPWFEVLLPILIFASLKWVRLRLPLAVLMFVFHGLLALSINVADISWICLIAWIPFLPVQESTRAEPKWLQPACAILLLVFFTLPQNISRRTGLLISFNHFAHSRASVWPRFYAAKNDAWSEVVIPSGEILPYANDNWPANIFLAEFNGDRMWLKFLTLLVHRPDEPKRAEAVEAFLCRRYGPLSEHGFTKFKWVFNRERDGERQHQAVRRHGC